MVMLARSGATSSNAAVHRLEPGDPRRCQGSDRPRRDGIDAHPVRAEVGREIAYGGLEGGLGHTHDVVVRDDLLRTVVGQGQDRRATAEVWPRLARERDERVGRDVHGQREPVARGVGEAAGQVLPLGERQSVDEDVERIVRLAPAREHPGDVVVGLDVAWLHEGAAERFGQRADALVDEALDRGEADLGAFSVQRPGDPPGDRMVVRDPEDQRRLAVEQAHSMHLSMDRRAARPAVSLPSGDVQDRTV